jgi:putative ABC transport system permease protein
MNDLRYAVRQLVRNPGFSLVVVLTLALGIGANTAIFSVVHGVVLRPLPYDAPDELVRVLGYNRDRGLDFGTISYPNYLDYRERNRSFTGMAIYDQWRPTLLGDEPVRVPGASVGASFFDVLGVRPALGRLFLPDEDGPGSAQVVVLRHDFWRDRFGADPAVMGRSINLGGTPYTVVGVLPASWEDPGLSGSWEAPQLFRPPPAYFANAARGSRSYTAIARLQPGVARAAAEADLNGIIGELAELYPESNANRALAVRLLRDDIVGGARTPLWIVFAAAGLVLLIACANIANLLVARAAARSREIGVRSALGAPGWMIGRQFLGESLLLAALGGAVGVGLAVLATDVLVALAGDSLPRALPPLLDWRVLGFTAGATLLAGVLFGAAPILEAGGKDVARALREDSRAATSGRRARRMRALVGVQMALSLTLLVGATLLVRSLWNLSSVDPGVAAGGVLVADLGASFSVYPDNEDITALYDAILPRVAALPGVDEVGAIQILPLSGSFNGNPYMRLDQPEPRPGEHLMAETRSVTPGYFRVMRIPLMRGRHLAESDREGAPRAVVVSESLAGVAFPDRDPVGARIHTLGAEWEIVGVVGDVHHFSLDRAPVPTIYTPHDQALYASMRRDMVLAVRGSGDVARLAAPIRRAVWSVAPTVTVENAGTMDRVVADTFAAQRFRTVLFALFAGLAMALGAVGIYGVVAYAVAQRVHEVGIRLALGAGEDRLVRMLVTEGMRPVLAGALVGLVAGVLGARSLGSLLFEVSPLDPATLALAVATLTGTALLAAWLPARRAARVDPMEALRHE